MPYLSDILLVAVFGLCVFQGYRRGFVRSVLGFGRLILSFAVAAVCGPLFSAWLKKTFLEPPVFDLVHGKLEKLAAGADGSMDKLLSSLPDVLAAHLEGTVSGKTENIYETIDEWSCTISDGISGAVASVLGTVLLFTLAFLALTLAMHALSGLIRMTPLAGFDQFLGLALGGIGGFVAVRLLAQMLVPLLVAIGKGELAAESLILKWFS